MSRERTPRQPTVGQQLDEELAARPGKSELTAVEVRLRTDLRETETRLRGEIHDVETRLEQKIGESEQRLRGEIQQVHQETRAYVKALFDGHTQKLAEELARHLGKPVPTKPRRSPTA